MKRFLVLLCILLCNHITADAEVFYEKEFWVKEIAKKEFLYDHMITKYFDVSIESYAYNVFGGSQSDMESWRRITSVVASVIKENPPNLKKLAISGGNNLEFSHFYINTFLDAVTYNRVIDKAESM